jgi:hypothetical protein
MHRILEEAANIVGGDRNDSYGRERSMCERVAKTWSGITGLNIEPHHIPLMMIGLKAVRESYCEKEDNRVDIVGYALVHQNALEQGMRRLATETARGDSGPGRDAHVEREVGKGNAASIARRGTPCT